MILTYVFIKHTYGSRFLRSTSCSLALSSSSFVFSVSDSVLSVVRVSLGCASTSCAAISTRKHKVRGGEECFVGERRAGTRRRAWRRSARIDDAAGVTSWGTRTCARSRSLQHPSEPPESHSDVRYILLMINICAFYICKGFTNPWLENIFSINSLLLFINLRIYLKITRKNIKQTNFTIIYLNLNILLYSLKICLKKWNLYAGPYCYVTFLWQLIYI